MLRVQCFHEPMPPLEEHHVGPAPAAADRHGGSGRAGHGRGRSRSGELRAHALGEARRICSSSSRPSPARNSSTRCSTPQSASSAICSTRRGRLAREHAAAVGGRGHALPGPGHADVVAQGERGRRRAIALPAEPGQLGAARAQLLRRAIDRMPGGPEAGRTAKRPRGYGLRPRWADAASARAWARRRVAELRVLSREATASALVHSSRIASRNSSVMAPRSGEGHPSMALSAATHPAPTPNTNRPPLSASSEEIILAVTTALRYGHDEHGGPELHPAGRPRDHARGSTSGSKMVSPKFTMLARGTTTWSLTHTES